MFSPSKFLSHGILLNIPLHCIIIVVKHTLNSCIYIIILFLLCQHFVFASYYSKKITGKISLSQLSSCEKVAICIKMILLTISLLNLHSLCDWDCYKKSLWVDKQYKSFLSGNVQDKLPIIIFVSASTTNDYILYECTFKIFH